MKGYDLCSWCGGAGWHCALVAGANRIRTYDEIAAPGACVVGIEVLGEKLARLPEGEQVFWSVGRAPGTTLPPAQTVEEVREVCDQLRIGLGIVDAGL